MAEQFFKMYYKLIDCPVLTGNDILVLISLMKHYNSDRKDSFPSGKTIQTESRMGRCTVMETLLSLEKRGVIVVERESGKRNIYRLPFMEDLSLLERLESSISNESKEQTCLPDRHVCHADQSKKQTTTSLKNRLPPVCSADTNYIKNNYIKELDINTPPPPFQEVGHENAPEEPKEPPQDFSQDFEEWYSHYPRHGSSNSKSAGKAPARKKFIALRKSGVSQKDLVSAVKNYAESVKDTEPRFVKYPEGFLNASKGMWKDFVQAEEKVAVSYRSQKGMASVPEKKDFEWDYFMEKVIFDGNSARYMGWILDGRRDEERFRQQFEDWRVSGKLEEFTRKQEEAVRLCTEYSDDVPF